MSSEYTLNLKAVLDTSQVQNELNRIRVQQNQLNGSASQNPSSPQNISPAINPNLGSLGTTLSRINSTLVALNQTMQRLNNALLQQRPSNIPSAPSSPGGYIGGGRGGASSYNILRYVMEMNNKNMFNDYKNSLGPMS